jgi:transcriptional regulator with XRE-family HTH domain
MSVLTHKEAYVDVSIGARIKAARTAAGMTQMDVARRTDLSLQAVGDIERGIVRDPHISSLRQIAYALDVPVEMLVKEEMAVPAFPLDDASDQEPGRSREERRSSRFAAAIAAAADSWGEAVSSNDMEDEKRFGLLDAALDLSNRISESVEEEDWDVIPNEERLEIVTAMEKLQEAAERGLRHLQETAETRTQAEQVKQRREQMREWTRSISA